MDRTQYQTIWSAVEHSQQWRHRERAFMESFVNILTADELFFGELSAKSQGALRSLYPAYMTFLEVNRGFRSIWTSQLGPTLRSLLKPSLHEGSRNEDYVEAFIELVKLTMSGRRTFRCALGFTPL